MILKKIRRDKKGVSPVIGVILMVAATIVIAAVVITMLGSFKAPAAPPTVSLKAEVTDDNELTFTHLGGGSVAYTDIVVTVTSGGTEAGLSMEESAAATGGDTDYFEPGEQATVDTTTASFEKGKNEKIDVLVIHKPSGSATWGGTLYS